MENPVPVALAVYQGARSHTWLLAPSWDSAGAGRRGPRGRSHRARSPLSRPPPLSLLPRRSEADVPFQMYIMSFNARNTSSQSRWFPVSGLGSSFMLAFGLYDQHLPVWRFRFAHVSSLLDGTFVKLHLLDTSRIHPLRSKDSGNS